MVALQSLKMYELQGGGQVAIWLRLFGEEKGGMGKLIIYLKMIPGLCLCISIYFVLQIGKNGEKNLN